MKFMGEFFSIFVQPQLPLTNQDKQKLLPQKNTIETLLVNFLKIHHLK